ncbi:NADH-ubiquinone oxidoreductase-F iron-sulfur binding region domain-containing protein [Actinokineospora sp. NBRC 105648]|uniref:NADH-ubiquinone oxidoreductase-F iron-sulfur binding region domain-containing protein n=1 Tax=Actinokineospora sp. NBRC 105648 TaxID=3032206 RepID=UPI0024A5E794|nr:NADH-ubiquinone oxidoreductase-F iron-sulfur binding region domain-containing protein [Actinokineospora sp. NBRC 105648]GLZ39468.1 NADH dehydrogenase [Actinokineospora sp. NBRC 105648]
MTTQTQTTQTAGRLLTPGPDHATHVAVHGALPGLTADTVEAAGLRGRGGAGFPTARKLRNPAAVVVANGCEGDPASAKDKVLLATAPHLVLDGLQLAAAMVGAREAVLCVHDARTVARAVAEHPFPVRVVQVPPRYVASEETALVNFLATGDARPTGKRPFEGRRKTLVDNVETLAQLAVLARVGPESFRRDESRLVTVDGQIWELPADVTIGEALRAAGRDPNAPALVGGFGGEWLAGAELVRLSAVPGVAAIRTLRRGTCGLAETAAILGYLAGESARQCGPCTFGLPAIAADFADLTTSLPRLRARLGIIPGRGACAHPDGATRLAESALRVFAADVAAHTKGRCLA